MFFIGALGSRTNPRHVGLHQGNDQMIEAPYTARQPAGVSDDTVLALELDDQGPKPGLAVGWPGHH